MNTDNVVQMMQKGFHITLGAASFLVDTAVTPSQQQRDDNLTKLQAGDFERLSEEWAVTGEQKEKEARTFVESVLPTGAFPGMPVDQGAEMTTTAGPSVPLDIQQDLEAMITELSEIRNELRNS